MGTNLPGTGTLGWGAWCGIGAPCSRDITSKFLSTTHGYVTSLSPLHIPPTSLGGCGFFNTIVVRLPFNSISDGSEWWLFDILVVILIWLCKEVSHVCLCHYLDQTSTKKYFWVPETQEKEKPCHVLLVYLFIWAYHSISAFQVSFKNSSKVMYYFGLEKKRLNTNTMNSS